MTKTIALPREIMEKARRRIRELERLEGEPISFSRYVRRVLIRDFKAADGKAVAK